MRKISWWMHEVRESFTRLWCQFFGHLPRTFRAQLSSGHTTRWVECKACHELLDGPWVGQREAFMEHTS